MCKEGGCGSCLVNAEIIDYSSKMSKNISINSVTFFLLYDKYSNFDQVSFSFVLL